MGSLRRIGWVRPYWVQILSTRTFNARFSELWRRFAKDPRFPNFVKVSPVEMLHICWVNEATPAESILLVLRYFAPRGYDLSWIEEDLDELGLINPTWYLNSFYLPEKAV